VNKTVVWLPQTEKLEVILKWQMRTAVSSTFLKLLTGLNTAVAGAFIYGQPGASEMLSSFGEKIQ
jgi:hypothetical protein